MVLWEITLGTAYFLGLKRTYRLALRIERNLISSKHPKIRQFVHRRTRGVFDVALRVHRNIQKRDLEVGRNLGNGILRWLDKLKPSAQIRGPPPVPPGSTGNSGKSMNMTKQIKNSADPKSAGKVSAPKDGETGRHMFSSRVTWSRPFPTIELMMKPANRLGSLTHHRHLGTGRLDFLNAGGKWDGAIRKDVMQWMLQK
ncbi:hypothetical protein SAY86_021399 [Trapa natans]|uniref:Uncharacterized protein n=1 Tax=Trapa natans TaxID=22666 RepID=A0AAN7RER7_TRANT|nr:hypothetical protein SAY86_021399 [Trapa natans]